MKLFFDTSALVKLFHDERGSELVIEWVEAKDNDIWVLELARIEFFCAVYRRRRNGEIDERQEREACDGFVDQLLTLHVEPMTQAVLYEAERLLKMHGREEGLRTLDALHLGAFSLIADYDWRFVAADFHLCRSAEKAGFRTLNPLTVEED